MRRTIPLYDQVYLYANRIKGIPRVNTPKNLKVISSPKMLCTMSPVSNILKHPGSCRNSPKASKAPNKSSLNQKSRFNTFGDSMEERIV